MRKFKLFLAVCVLLAGGFFAARFVLGVPAPVNAPETYEKGSELYYLAWICHGEYPQRTAAAKRLLELSERREIEITRSIWGREHRRMLAKDDGLVRHILTLALFELQPDEYEDEAAALLTLKSSEYGHEGTWMKTDDYFEGEQVDFYFDWGGEAALRLLRRGVLADNAFPILLQYAGSFYPDQREWAAEVLHCFDGIPDYSPSEQPLTYNEMPSQTREAIEQIRRWYDEHKDRLVWDQVTGRYCAK